MSTSTDLPQHMAALAKGNKIRLERAALKEWVREPADAIVSRHRLADIIDTEGPVSPCVSSLPLEKFLSWGWNLYPFRRQGCYELATVNAGRTLDALSPRQRRVIANALRMPAAELEEARKLHEWQRQRGLAA